MLEISISGTKTVKKKHTEYEIVCITNNKSFRRCYIKVFRRYNDFHKLHSKLKCFVQVLPEFPKKRWNKLHKDVIEERVQMFTVYLRFVCDYILREKKNSDKISADVIGFMQDDLETL